MLSAAGATIVEERSSGKTPLTEAEAREILGGVAQVVVARGRRRESIPRRQATINHLKGPTGGFRAPMIRIGGQLLVGLQLDSLRSLLTD